MCPISYSPAERNQTIWHRSRQRLFMYLLHFAAKHVMVQYWAVKMRIVKNLHDNAAGHMYIIITVVGFECVCVIRPQTVKRVYCYDLSTSGDTQVQQT